MHHVPFQPTCKRPSLEAERLNALYDAEILDTAPDPALDALISLASEHFKADIALLGFIDEERVWVKSVCGTTLFELAREDVIFNLILETGQTTVIGACGQQASVGLPRPLPGRLESDALGLKFLAGAPVRSAGGHILGALVIGRSEAQECMEAADQEVLERIAVMVESYLELMRLRRMLASGSGRRSKARQGSKANPSVAPWPRPADLRRALDQDEFVLYYQPELDLTTHRIIGMEALIRWQHPERGLIFPDQFIPLAEECGMFLPIGRWGLRQACMQIRTWTTLDPALHSMRVCVNLSARQFAQAGLSEHIRGLIRETGISGHQIGVEMTETSLISNIKTAVNVLQGLRELGIVLLMDDFGTGYSSLNYLQTFSFDILKIDRSFVMRLEEGDSPRQIVRTIIELARVLGMDVVAEGIETMEQYRLLRKMGCRYGQGYLFARPLPVDQMTKLLELPGYILPDSAFDLSLAGPRAA